MSSFAIWLRKLDKNSTASNDVVKVELHFNFWYAYYPDKDKERARPILDIGVLLHGFSHVESLNFYFPFTLNPNETQDLGKLLRNDTTLNAVFNDSHRIKSTSGGKAFLVSCEDRNMSDGNSDENDFIVYMLDSCQDLEIRPRPYDADEKGTSTSIKVSKLIDLLKEGKASDCDKCYFRFRIESDELRSVLIHHRNHSMADAFFHDALTRTKVLEFRLNHSRSLPPSLREEIRGCGDSPPICALHFFLLTDETVDLLNDNRATIRRLEKDVWKEYLPNNTVDDEEFANVVAYHWKKTLSNGKSFFDWDLYAKLNILFRNWKTLALYMTVIIVLGVIGSGLWAVLSKAIIGL